MLQFPTRCEVSAGIFHNTGTSNVIYFPVVIFTQISVKSP